jgi:hypothetical protein
VNTDKTILSVAVTLVILGSIFFVIERVIARGRNRAQPIIRKGWLTDVVYWFTTILLTKPLVRLMLILPLSVLILAKVTSLDVLKVGSYTGFGPLSRQRLLASSDPDLSHRRLLQLLGSSHVSPLRPKIQKPEKGTPPAISFPSYRGSATEQALNLTTAPRKNDAP